MVRYASMNSEMNWTQVIKINNLDPIPNSQRL